MAGLCPSVRRAASVALPRPTRKCLAVRAQNQGDRSARLKHALNVAERTLKAQSTAAPGATLPKEDMAAAYAEAKSNIGKLMQKQQQLTTTVVEQAKYIKELEQRIIVQEAELHSRPPSPPHHDTREPAQDAASLQPSSSTAAAEQLPQASEQASGNGATHAPVVESAAAPPQASGNGSAPAPPAIQLAYYTGWKEVFLHYSVDGKQWTKSPGARMREGDGEFEGAKVMDIDGTTVEFVLNNGGGQWDSPAPFGDGPKNYKIDRVGKYKLKSGKLTPLN